MSNVSAVRKALGFMRGNILILTLTRVLGQFCRSMVFPYASLYILALGGKPAQIGQINALMPLAGLAPGDYELGGRPVTLESNGWLHCKDSDQLAGSGRDMLDCMNYLASLGVLTEPDLEAVGFRNPLVLLGIDPQSDIVGDDVGLRFVDDGLFRVEEGR